ncbi:MAG: MerR family transcriptional regulator [Deltaproteobacteria bacterium]|nr:MerR family transcriptional regulator [Deltaproteobacteria bacterium]
MPTYTVGRLAARCGLSRSTLLYYDSIGLFRPSGRSESRYRLYGEDDRRKLEAICRYREVGLTLREIGQVIGPAGDRTVEVLGRRLGTLNLEIARLREQQRVVARLLRGRAKLPRMRSIDKARWVALLRASGLSDEDMHRWHVEFERLEPEGHQDFLESLGIEPGEVARIRAWSSADGVSAPKGKARGAACPLPARVPTCSRSRRSPLRRRNRRRAPGPHRARRRHRCPGRRPRPRVRARPRRTPAPRGRRRSPERP